jgi:hypothetical protein
MQVFVISKCERETGDGPYVSAVRSSLEKAEAFVRSEGKLREWRPNREGQEPGAFAVVWVGSRRRGSEYCFFVRALELE